MIFSEPIGRSKEKTPLIFEGGFFYVALLFLTFMASTWQPHAQKPLFISLILANTANSVRAYLEALICALAQLS